MPRKFVLLLVAVSLALLFLATEADEQEQDIKKRTAATSIGQTPTTLANVIKILTTIQKRLNELESSRTLRGRDGRDGKPGRDGQVGLPGKQGRDGQDGLPGKPGPPGLKGEQGMQGVRGPPGPKSGGVQYVRWGRTTCPYNVSLVYKGRIGGSHLGHSGGGANYVCLPETPKYGRYHDGYQDAGYMYGTEYYLKGFNPFTKSHLHDHEAPCVVCYVTTRSVTMMIPATYECPVGWTREYHGYLMSERVNHNAKVFICVDEDAEAVPGTHANLDGAMLYPVEGRCGALPCRPYVEGRELTCVVCTK